MREGSGDMRFGSVRKIPALAALIVALCLLSSCFGSENFVQTVFMSSDVRGAFVISPQDHFCVFNGDMLLTESGSLACYFDEKTGNIGVYDRAGDALWSALPTFANRTAAVISVEAFNGTATYLLNSQDHAVAYGTVTSETADNGATVTYVMAEHKETARKQPGERVRRCAVDAPCGDAAAKA